MERALAVVEATEAAKDLVREAAELADGVGAELVLVHVTDEEAYAERREAMEKIPDHTVAYSVGRASDGARDFAEDIGKEVLGDTDIKFEAIGRVGDKRDRILETADRYGCDHVFLTGRKRSPTGKAIFGDTAQQIILDFDGAVTVVTE